MQKSGLPGARQLQEKMGQLGLDCAGRPKYVHVLPFGTMQCQYVCRLRVKFRPGTEKSRTGGSGSGIPLFPSTVSVIWALQLPLAAHRAWAWKWMFCRRRFSGCKSLPQSELLNAAPAIREVRQVKSYELEQFRLAAQQVDTLYRQIRNFWKSVKKKLFAAECEAVLRSLGHQNQPHAAL